MKIAIANFKAELNPNSAKTWLQEFKGLYQANNSVKEVQIILCPPDIFLNQFKQELSGLNISLGCQNISQFEQGAYTGEITAPMLSGLADYVLIGHSERRTYFQESQEVLQKKIDLATRFQLKIILCTEKEEAYNGEFYAVAFEPHLAIGTGEAGDPQQSWVMTETITRSVKTQFKLYGGSVNEQNALDFTRAGFNGVLVGKKSLSPRTFLEIVGNL